MPLNNVDVVRQSGNWTVGPVPSFLLNYARSDSDTKLIAKPQLRVSEGERAEILIGDRVPIPTTSFNTSQTIGGNIVPITSFTYQNVGITVQIEPRVHHNKEVTLQVTLEISQLGASIDAGQGLTQPTIGTRQIQTVIRLRDGETNMLAGLIQHTESKTYSGLPGIAKIPGLKWLFGSRETNRMETDIVMTLTPHIIRIPDITEEDLVTLWVGTEDHMRLRGRSANALRQSPFGAGPTTLPGAPAGSIVGQPGTGSEGGAAETRPAESGVDTGGGGNGGDSDEARRPPRPGREEQTEQEQERPGGGPAIVRLLPGQSGAYNVGQQVLVQVTIENAQGIGSVPFHLRYNPNVLQFVSHQEGPFMSLDGTNTVFLASDRAVGDVVVGLSRMGGRQGASGSGLLASFTFLAVNPGDCGFAFSGANVKDPQAGNLPAGFNTAIVKVLP